MEFLRRIFRKQSAPVHDPVALRDALFAAAGSGNKAALSELCAVNRDMILRHFAEWMNVGNYSGLDPKDNRQVQYVLNGLALTATVFRDELKDPSLWDRLEGPKETNPFGRFEEMFGRAKSLAGERRYDEAADLLTTFLIETKGLSGPGADHFRSFCHGLLGHCRFDANRAQDALDHYQQALSLCEAMGDAEGTGVYLASLFEVHRYLGHGEQAAAYADRLADHHGNTPGGNRWRTRAQIVRRGEPLLRMVAQHDGRVCEIDQMGKLKGKFTFLFERNRRTLAPADALTAEGDQLAARQEYDEALGRYRDAAHADPFDPQPHYLAGLTLLILQRYPQAVEEYEATSRLAPGWFHVGSNLWIANELLAGRLPHEAFMALWLLQDGRGASPAQRLELADQVVQRFPSFPHLHLVRALALEAVGRKADAIAAIRSGLAAGPEPDVHSRLLVQLAVLSDPPARRTIFEEVRSIAGANLMSRTMAEVMLRQADS